MPILMHLLLSIMKNIPTTLANEDEPAPPLNEEISSSKMPETSNLISQPLEEPITQIHSEEPDILSPVDILKPQPQKDVVGSLPSVKPKLEPLVKKEE